MCNVYVLYNTNERGTFKNCCKSKPVEQNFLTAGLVAMDVTLEPGEKVHMSY